MLLGKGVKQISPVLWQDNFSLRSVGGAFFLGALSLIFLVVFIFRLPPQIPLFYSRPWGEDQLASSTSILLLPSSIFLILIVNLLIIGFLAKERLVLRMLGMATLTCAFLLLFAQINIIRLSL